MTPPIFALTEEAAVRGGAVAGQYLQEIGQTDLAKLNVGQFNLFCCKLVGGAFGAALGDYMEAAERPPF